MVRILFVEDNDRYRKSISNILEEAGYEVETASNALDAIEKVSNKKYDLIISDLKMEELDGVQFLTIVKRLDENVKTMILTAEPSMDSEFAALDILVDRYLEKDKRSDVLLKHIEILLQEAKNSKAARFILREPNDGVEVDILGRCVKKNDVEIKVTPKEFAILQLLLENKGKAVSRDDILEEVWDLPLEDVEPRVVDVHIKELRRKLNLQSIVSIRGFGYKWD